MFYLGNYFLKNKNKEEKNNLWVVLSSKTSYLNENYKLNKNDIFKIGGVQFKIIEVIYFLI